MNLIRAYMVIILSILVGRLGKIDLNYALKNSFWTLLVRNILSVLWIGVMTWCLYYLSLAVIFSINICGSLLVFVWDMYIYKMHLSGYQKVGVGCGIFGAILVINANYFLTLVDASYAMHTDFEYFKSS